MKTVATTAAAVAPAYGQNSPVKKQTMVGIQLTVGPLAEQGVDRVLDTLQQSGRVNTLFLYVFTYIRERANPRNPKFHGGNFATVHPQYYQGTALKPEDMRSPDFGDFDVLASVIPAAKKRGMKTYCWIIEDNTRPPIPNMESLWERDLYGRVPPRHPAGPCLNNPNQQNFLQGLLEDYLRSYDIDGVMWGAERQGPLGNSLGAFHNGARTDPGGVTCFCQYCQQKAAKLGIDFKRTQEGFRALESFVRQGRAGKRPRDGYYVTFWRILLEYPEILGWERFWTNSIRETYQSIYRKVKSIRPDIPVGWHIWHNASFNPIYRAEQDYAELSKYSDFVKPVLYNNCAGERMVSYLESVGANVFGDIPKQELLQFEYRIMNYNEGPLEQLPAIGLSSDYVYRETKLVLEGVSGTKTVVWPGIDIDVPTGRSNSKCTPQSVRDTVLAAYRAGAQGVLLSRNYLEMKPENLRAAGEAIEQLGFA